MRQTPAELIKRFNLLIWLPLSLVKADKLDTAIANAIFPPSSELCNGEKINETTFTSVSSSPENWNAANANYEEDAFEIEMSHNDSINSNHTWSLRIGKGGQIMSLIGPYGEANANQASVGAPWVDLVTQIVSVDTKQNTPVYPYFIHGSGTYMHDIGMPPPFYNPKLALDCQSNQCTSVNWGQQAHVPTVHRSDAIYYQRYRDCGSGIIEYDEAIYHSGRDSDVVLNYLNTPWSNVRTSTFGQMQISNPSGELDKPIILLGFGAMPPRNLDTTGGFTTFSQIPDEAYFVRPYDPGFCIDPSKKGNGAVANVPCSTPGAKKFRLTVQEDNTALLSLGHTKHFGYNIFYMDANNLTAPVKQGCHDPPGGGIIVTNSRTNFKFTISHVHHWSWAGSLFFFTPSSRGITASILNDQFKKGDKLILSYSLKKFRTYNPGFCIDPKKEGNGAVANVPCSMPDSLHFELTTQADNTAKLSKGHTNHYGYNVLFMNANNLKAPVKEGCMQPPDNGITVTNSRTNFQFIISHVIHWAWGGNLFFFSPGSSGVSASFINEQFKKGDKLLLTYAVIPENINLLSLSFVHGRNSEFHQPGNSFYNAKSRMRYGTTSSTRDGTVWTTNFMGNLNPTETYFNRKYLISGNTNDIESTAPSYVSETMEDIFPVGELSNTGESIHLFLVDKSFGASIGSDVFCPETNARHVCTGSSIPKENLRPMYYITCGEGVSYVGDETYHFIPDKNDGILRPYICKDQEISVRPTYKLLGYFVVSDCLDIRETKYNGNLCSPQFTGASNTLKDVTNVSFSNQTLLLSEGETHNQLNRYFFFVSFSWLLLCMFLFGTFYPRKKRNEYISIPDDNT